MKRKLAAAVAIVLLLGVGCAGYVWYRHATRVDPFAPPAPDASEAPVWTPPPTPDAPEAPVWTPPPTSDASEAPVWTPPRTAPEDKPGPPQDDPPEDTLWPRKFVPPTDWSPESSSLLPLDRTPEIPEVPTELTDPAPPIEDKPEQRR
ncbi:MAG: hypothetical protein HQ567_29130 [Candidatus Nealsonbacteria bacterium]|nr:hypothetical protein [Candidatus Nealsonbacteria bacterium]